MIFAILILEELEPAGRHLCEVSQVAVYLFNFCLDAGHQLVGFVLVELQDALHLNLQQTQYIVLCHLSYEGGVVGRQTLINMFTDTVDVGSLFEFLIFVNAFVIEKEDGREMFSVPAQQLAAIYNDGSADMDSEERRIVERLIGKEALGDYVPTMADNTKAGLDMEFFKENRALVVKTYLSLIGKNPKTAIEGFLSNCLGFWYPGCELTLFDDGRKGYWVVGEYPPAVMNSKLPFLLKYFELFNDSDFVMKNPVTSLLFAPGTFFWLFVLFFAYAIDGKKISYFPVFAFILALWLTYLLGPLAMVRYAIYLYGLVPIYPALVRSDEGSPE